jgi:probable phosphoglycerate mutase
MRHVDPSQQIVLVRHGQTEWSAAGRHTGRTDVPLTEEGRRQARALAVCLQRWRLTRVLASPLQRATETARLAGFEEAIAARPDLMEWDYGQYEGRTTAEIRQERPDWMLWRDGVPGGETVEHVGRRADRVIEEVRGVDDDVALFAHGHILRVLGARWIGLPPDSGSRLALDTATVCVLGYERETPVIRRWNEACTQG